MGLFKKKKVNEDQNSLPVATLEEPITITPNDEENPTELKFGVENKENEGEVVIFLNTLIADSWSSIENIKSFLKDVDCNQDVKDILEQVITDKTVEVGVIQKAIEKATDTTTTNCIKDGEDKADELISQTTEIKDESLLTERMWEHKISRDTALAYRNAVKQEETNYEEVKNALRKIAEECQQWFEDDWELESIIDDIDCLSTDPDDYEGAMSFDDWDDEDDIYDDYEDEDYDIDTEYDGIIDRLFDFLDSNSIWLPID